MDAKEWIQRQAKAKDEVYALISKGGIDNLLCAVDVAWKEYCNFQGPTMMTTGRKTARVWQSLSNFANRMVVDAACALAFERSKEAR